MALTPKGNPIATVNDYALLASAPEGIRIMADLEAQFEFDQPSFRSSEILESAQGADTFAKLRDGNREVIQYIKLQFGANLTK